MSNYTETGLVFSSGSNRLVGVASTPEKASDVAVLFIVGGPQYRVGSHRQFTLLARRLAQEGIGSLRFDYAGMGDSEGARASFENVEGDITAALAALKQQVPESTSIVLWGLCDAASTALMCAHRFAQIKGLVLLNPWVHGGEYTPGFRLSHYYRPLLTEKDYWRRLLTGQVNIAPAFGDAARAVKHLIGGGAAGRGSTAGESSFVGSMLEGLKRFEHSVLFVLSENDLTAKEFLSLTTQDEQWKACLQVQDEGAKKRVQAIAGADHTFSKRLWQDEVSDLTLAWLRETLR